MFTRRSLSRSVLGLCTAAALAACGSPATPGGGAGDRAKAQNDGDEPRCAYGNNATFGAHKACAKVEIRKLDTGDGPALTAQLMGQAGQIHYGLDAEGKPLYRWEVKTLHGWRACLTSDIDGDGVVDYSDNCPNNWGPAGPFAEGDIDYRPVSGWREADASDCSYTSPEWATIEGPAPTSGAKTFRLVLRARSCNRFGLCTPGTVASEGMDFGAVDGGGTCGYAEDYDRIAWNSQSETCVAIPRQGVTVETNADGLVALDSSCCMEALANSCTSLRQTYLDMLNAGDPDGTVCTGTTACEQYPVVPGCTGFFKPVPSDFLDQVAGSMNGVTIRKRLAQWTQAWKDDGCHLTSVGACNLFTAQALTSPVCTDPAIICGTIMGLSNCPSGMSCTLDGDFPDAGGTCQLNP